MIDKEKLQEYLEVYKEDFYPYIWKEKDEETGTPFEGERFKWVAVRTFRDNWNIEAEDFPGMLKDSLSATGKLLDGSQPYPKDAIIKLAVKVPEEVRDMFRKLFDEESGEDVINRIFDFKRRSENLFEQYGDKSKKHSQDEHAISVYLWLHEPDKYYIYKFKEVERASTAFDNSDYIFTKGAYEDNLRNFFRLL